jgi:transcriptional regulator with XRE-family HTH domain
MNIHSTMYIVNCKIHSWRNFLLPARDEAFGRRLEQLLPWGTRAAFAKKIGLNKNQLSAYLKGQIPKAPTLKRIADGLSVSVDYLLGEEDSPHKVTQRVESAKNVNLTDLSEVSRSVIVESVKKLSPADQEEFYLTAAIFLESKMSESEEATCRSLQFIKGSYARQLAIRPCADVDLVVMDASGELHRLIFQVKSTPQPSFPIFSSPNVSDVGPKAASSKKKGSSDAAKADKKETPVKKKPV